MPEPPGHGAGEQDDGGLSAEGAGCDGVEGGHAGLGHGRLRGREAEECCGEGPQHTGDLPGLGEGGEGGQGEVGWPCWREISLGVEREVRGVRVKWGGWPCWREISLGVEREVRGVTVKWGGVAKMEKDPSFGAGGEGGQREVGWPCWREISLAVEQEVRGVRGKRGGVAMLEGDLPGCGAGGEGGQSEVRWGGHAGGRSPWLWSGR